MIQKVSLLLTFIFSSSLISIFELGFGTFCHRILKVKSQTLEETKVFSLDSAYFSLVFSVCQTWCLVFSVSDRMFGVFAVRHDVWCFSSQTRCLVFATHGVGWSLVWVGLPNVYSYYEAWGKPEQQASFMCFLIFHRPSGFVHLFLSVVFLFLAIITCHVKAQEGGSQTSCGKRRGWSQAQRCVRWADKFNVLVQRQASVPAGWSSRGHLFCSRLFFAQSWISGGGWWWRTGRPAESTTAGHGFQRSAACQLPSFFDLLLVILVLKRVLISVLVAVAVRVSFAAHCRGSTRHFSTQISESCLSRISFVWVKSETKKARI